MTGRLYVDHWHRIAAQVWIDECDCWIWLGSRRRHGGGDRPAMTMRVQGVPNPRQFNVARIVCELVHGPAPSPLHEASHLCVDEWLCVSPDHLLWETKRENIARRDSRPVDPDWRAGCHTDNKCPF